MEVIALDSFGNQFTDPFICDIIVPEADEGEIHRTITCMFLLCPKCHCRILHHYN